MSTLEQLTVCYTNWIRAQDLPLLDAGDLLEDADVTLSGYQIGWLLEFLKLWESTQQIEKFIKENIYASNNS